MVVLIYKKLAPYLAPFFLLTTIVFFAMCVWRGEVILGLQAEAIKDKDKEIKVVIEQHDSENKISLEYEQQKTNKQQEKIYVDRTVEKIITVPSYSNLCFDTDGMQSLNSYITQINSSRKPADAVSTNQGAE